VARGVFFICTPASSKSDKYADCMSVMTYMSFKETEQWQNTYNVIGHTEERGAAYEAFKDEKSEQVLKTLEKVFPDIRAKIKKCIQLVAAHL